MKQSVSFLASSRRRELRFLVFCLASFGLISPMQLSVVQAADDKTVEARQGMVVTVSPPGTDVGVEILKKGGNAVDAAVATAFALAVTHPAAGNIGGGGFMVVFPGGKAEPVVIEYRETAPAAATKTMFSPNESRYGYKVIGVPGTIRGLALAHQRFGKLPWKDLVLPAEKLARHGFVIDVALASSLNSIVSSSKEYPELRRVLGKKNGSQDWQAGDRLVQPDLAETLRQIAEQGPDAFYTGPIADQIVAEMKAGASDHDARAVALLQRIGVGDRHTVLVDDREMRGAVAFAGQADVGRQGFAGDGPVQIDALS